MHSPLSESSICEHGCFVSHSSDGKASFVAPLAERLRVLELALL